MSRRFVFPLFFLFIISCSPSEKEPKISVVENKYAPDSLIQKIQYLYDSIDANNPGGWLTHNKVEEISFLKYKNNNPVKANAKRNIIYIKPIGRFDTSQYNVIDMAAQILSVAFHKRVKVLSAVMPDSFPTSAYRKGQIGLQLNTQFVMKKYLRPKLPTDAVVYIALTTVDLWPGNDWNYVFGQSMLKGRVGVWSVRRLCDGRATGMDTLCLRRALKVAVHEVGHLFSIKHCKNFRCIMNGSISLEESDDKPAHFCPNCLQKLCWNNEQELADHLFRMKKFWEFLGDAKATEFYKKNLSALEK